MKRIINELGAMFRCRTVRERLVSIAITLVLSIPLMIPVVLMRLEKSRWAYVPVLVSALAASYITRYPTGKSRG